MQSIRNNAKLDTPEFRSLAPALKDFGSESPFWHWGTSMPYRILDTRWRRFDFNPHFLFDSFFLQANPMLMERDDLHIIPVAGNGTQSSADAVLLTVNPGSANLTETLAYITAVCNYLLTKENNFMLRREPTVSEYARRLHAAYAESVIDFAVSEEIITDDFDRYLRGEIDLDTMIREADRKLAMYRGE
jgi:hypothetical protein